MAVVVAFAVATCVGLFALWLSARRAITVCVLEVSSGKVHVTQGGLSPRIMSDIEDVVRRPKVKSATIRVYRDRELARVDASGSLTPDQRQQLLNIVGNTPVSRLVGGKRAASKA